MSHVAFHTFPVPEFSSPAFSRLAFSVPPLLQYTLFQKDSELSCGCSLAYMFYVGNIGTGMQKIKTATMEYHAYLSYLLTSALDISKTVQPMR